ncbi:MAG: hypothetical protein IKX05_02625, partial [Bacteroidales bacterium]|nr:hypothetical protein [Bacteroidales bacterium]
MAKMPEPETIDVPALARACAAGDIDLICVLGPTASGKTRYAVQLAKSLSEALAPAGARPYPGFCGSKNIEGEKAAGDNRGQSPFKAEILSGDSRQIYRSMDIGTGKDLCEYGDVPYHLIDIVPAGSKFNIYQYQAAFAKAYADVRSRGCIPILCGGSGLYIEAVTRAYKFEKENGLPAEQLPSKVYYIGTLVSREERVARIDRRLEERLQEGLVEEIRGLLETVPAQDLIYYGLEYKFV